MFERFTAMARAAVVHSRQAALAGGKDTIDSLALLIGLLEIEEGDAARCLAEAGIELQLLRRIHADRPSTPREGPAPKYPPFTDEYKQALEMALREALALGHPDLDTGHLLLGVVGTPEGVGAAALASAGVDPRALRAAVLTRCPPAPHPVRYGSGVLEGEWTAAEIPARLPGRAATVRVMVGMSLWYLLVGALLLRLGHGSDGIANELIYLLLGPLAVLAGLLLVHSRSVARALRKLNPASTAPLPVPTTLRDLLAMRGITVAEFRLERGTVRSRCLRSRSRAWAVLAERHAANNDLRRFVIPHEIAHLLRNDAFTGQVNLALATGLCEGAVESTSAAALVVGIVGALLLFVGKRWGAELSCDLAAARWTGTAHALSWLADTRALWRQPQNRKITKRLRRGLLGPLTHPPLWFRSAWLTARSGT